MLAQLECVEVLVGNHGLQKRPPPLAVTFFRTGNKHVSLAPNYRVLKNPVWCGFTWKEVHRWFEGGLNGLLLFTFMTEGLEGMDFERIASTRTRSCATACTNCLPSLFNAFVILQCASCQHDLLDQACTSVALALGAYPLLRRWHGLLEEDHVANFVCF